MRRRSFLRLLGLGIPGLALFGRAARADRGVIICDAEFRATRLDPDGIVNVEVATDEPRNSVNYRITDRCDKEFFTQHMMVWAGKDERWYSAYERADGHTDNERCRLVLLERVRGWVAKNGPCRHVSYEGVVYLDPKPLTVADITEAREVFERQWRETADRWRGARFEREWDAAVLRGAWGS